MLGRGVFDCVLVAVDGVCVSLSIKMARMLSDEEFLEIT